MGEREEVELVRSSAASRVVQSLVARVRAPGTGFGLSAKLLALTGLFVMLSEVLIFVPSMANFRVNWLADRVNAAHLAALASDAVPGGIVPPMIRNELLSTAQVKGVAVKRMGQRRLVLPPEDELSIDATFDVRPMMLGLVDKVGHRLGLITDALSVFLKSEGRTIRVLGHPATARGGVATAFPYGADDFVEIILPEAPLRSAMLRFALNILGLSIIISGITAGLVYWALRGLLVSPMMRLSRNMMHFSASPEDASRIIVPSQRTDEIGVTERELARMQTELVQLLQQKNRLAELGLAVAKINHDLRNMLSTAQLMSDRLAALPDPAVQRFSPKLIQSLDRAIAFCNDTLRYGQAEEPAPHRRRLALLPMVQEVGEGLGLPRANLGWQVNVPQDLMIDADAEQLYRVLNNLVRNAVQALEGQSERDGCVTVSGVRTGNVLTLRIADNGPGVPPKALANLFRAFKGNSRKGGAGLGLAIAAELVAAHGGHLRHESANPGAVFVLEIPDRRA